MPSKQQIERGTYKKIDGTWCKLCTGPAHDEPTYLPATPKYFHARQSGERKGDLLSRCRLCINWSKLKSPGSAHGYVPVAKALPFYIEAVNRVGLMELSRRTGLSSNQLNNVLRSRVQNVQKASLRVLMLELTSMRRKDEHSINKNAQTHITKRANGRLCASCGTSLDNYTNGCKVCSLRKHKRALTQAA